MQDWIAATRPRTLAAAFAPLVLATGWLLAHEQFHVLPVGLAALAALCFQIGCNFVNDVADFERGADQDRVDGDKPQRAVASGRISSQAMWRAAGLMLGLGLGSDSGWRSRSHGSTPRSGSSLRCWRGRIRPVRIPWPTAAPRMRWSS